MMIGVIGGGAWGTALAQMAAANGEDVMIWAREADVVAAINHDRQNHRFLAGVDLSPHVVATNSLDALCACDVLMVVVPAQHVRAVLSQAPVGCRPLVMCAKGIEADTELLMSQVAAQLYPGAPVMVLSGPTFAREVATGLPTAVTIASDPTEIARGFATRIARPHFRPYVSSDVIGAEIGGAVKNVLAIASGVVAGRRLGRNAAAALIARGYAEMLRFGLARGARAETLGGLSGLGDLVLTCGSAESRNFSLGVGLGEGKSADDLLAGPTVAEGAATAPVLRKAARSLGVEMPVVDAVAALLDGAMSVDDAIAALLARPLRHELS